MVIIIISKAVLVND